MRIVAGLYGGRRLLTPKGADIRPTSDKVRGAIFNALVSMGAVEDAKVLDAFCGTGALGLEAISRGAAHCTFIDIASSSLSLAKENAGAMGVEESGFIKGNGADAKILNALGQRYDLVFIDPPYRKGLADACLSALIDAQGLNEHALCVIEAEKGYEPKINGAFEVQSTKTYGDSVIWYLRYAQTPE